MASESTDTLGKRQRDKILASDWLSDESMPDPPAAPDPYRAIRRIAAAVLVRALLDAQFTSPYVRDDAVRFLEARDEQSREMLRLLVLGSGIDREWFRRRLGEFLNGAAVSGIEQQSAEPLPER